MNEVPGNENCELGFTPFISTANVCSANALHIGTVVRVKLSGTFDGLGLGWKNSASAFGTARPDGVPTVFISFNKIVPFAHLRPPFHISITNP